MRQERNEHRQVNASRITLQPKEKTGGGSTNTARLMSTARASVETIVSSRELVVPARLTLFLSSFGFCPGDPVTPSQERCPLLAQNGHAISFAECPLWGLQRT